MSSKMALLGAFVGAIMALYGLWRVLSAARKGKTAYRGKEVYRNVSPKDFWMVTGGDLGIIAVGVALLIGRLDKL